MVHEGSGPKPVLERQQQVGSKPFNPGPAAAQLSACGEFNEFKGLEKRKTPLGSNSLMNVSSNTMLRAALKAVMDQELGRTMKRVFIKWCHLPGLHWPLL